MTFMRKLLDMLNMENWNTSNEKTAPSLQIGAERVNQEEEERARREERERILAVERAREERKAALRKEKESFKNHMEHIEELLNYAEAQQTIFHSNRMIIPGLHLYFIDIVREIATENAVKKIPLMREYRLSENELNEVIHQIQEAGILDSSQNILITKKELEKFLDIYEPNLFKCQHSVFDKDIFMVMGEIIFDNGIEDTYNSLSADEVVDYLNIMENLKIILYNDRKNNY